MSDSITFQFEADSEGGPWVRIRVWPESWFVSRVHSLDSTIFELSEPVRIKKLNEYDPERPGVWWIEQFREEQLDSCKVVRLRSTRTIRLTTAYTEVQPYYLEKLPAMLRIAHEARDD